jgi:ribosomal protein S18 acetylase RimI-like enzyme
MQIKIRPADERDCERLLELLAQIGELHHISRPDIFQAGLKKYNLEQLQEILNNIEKPVFAAVNTDGFLVGYAFCQIINYENHPVFNNYKSFYIDDVCVDKNYRNQGIGLLLLEKCKGFAKEQGCYCIDLNVWKFNESAVKFYEKCGFETKSFRMEYIV